MARWVFFCCVIGVLLSMVSSTNLRSEKQQRSLVSNKEHKMGEIDWLYRGVGGPTKSPSAGLHKPTWKPSFKPIESDVIVSLNPRTVGLGGLKGDDHKADEKEIVHVVPSHNINEKKTPVAEIEVITTTVTDNIVPETEKVVSSSEETVVSSSEETIVPSSEETIVSSSEETVVTPSTSNLLPLDPTVIQDESQTIEDVVAHTTITVAPTNTDSSGNSAEISAIVDSSNLASSPRPMNSVNSKTAKAPIVSSVNSIQIVTTTPSVINDVSSKSVITPSATSTMTSSKTAKKEEKQEAKKEEKAEKKAAKEQEREEEVSKSAKESKRTKHEKGEEAKDEKPVMFIPLYEQPYTNMKNLDLSE